MNKQITSNTSLATIEDQYRRFATEEAHGRSALYERLAHEIAGDRFLIEFLLTLPAAKRQPNLFLAAVRYLAKSPLAWPDFKRFIRSNTENVHALMLARSTQTNEPARCAVLLPLLAALPQPLALLEVGASAGLCLLPDYYRYDYGGHLISGDRADATAPTFMCQAMGLSPGRRKCPTSHGGRAWIYTLWM